MTDELHRRYLVKATHIRPWLGNSFLLRQPRHYHKTYGFSFLDDSRFSLFCCGAP